MRTSWERAIAVTVASLLILAPSAGLGHERTTQTGKASWYGQRFQGRTAASGERYNPDALTAAHPTLPLGTRVKVTNLENGRTVSVEITDRGPRRRDRIIDLSRAAAHTIGARKDGVVPVRIQVVRRPVATSGPGRRAHGAVAMVGRSKDKQ